MKARAGWQRSVARVGMIPLAAGLALSTGSFGTLHAHASSGALGHLTYLGVSTPSTATSGSASSLPDKIDPRRADHASTPLKSSKPALTNPSPNATAVSASRGGSHGFQGITNFTQSGASGFSLEPPDQGLCVGNGFVLESVNVAFAVYKPSGTPLTSPIFLNDFFKTNVNDFLSDPKCYFDNATGRWFQTILQIDAPGRFTSHPTDRTHVLIAVSTSGSPLGTWGVFSLDTSNDGNNGTPKHPGCPCLPDQPLIGANHDGFFISTNEFQAEPGFPFNGAQVYAVSKAALEATSGTPGFVHFDTLAIPTGDASRHFWGSIQPAVSPTGDSQSRDVEFLLSTGPEDINQNNPPLDNRIVVWALTGTENLNDASPDVNLVHRVIHSEVYGPGVNLSAGELFSATQKNGPTPLRDLLHALDPINNNDPLARLNANDSRMNQVVYADGRLFSGVNTVVSTGGPDRVGIAYFVVEPQLENDGVSGSIQKQGYVNATGANVLFPSIGVTADGRGAMAFSLSGPGNWPSAGFVRFDEDGTHGPIHISAAGTGPDDGFTAYGFFGGGGAGRWGDYSTAVATPGGQIWMGNEYIGQTCTFAQFTGDNSCGGTRTTFANWGTFVSHISTGDNGGNGDNN